MSPFSLSLEYGATLGAPGATSPRLLPMDAMLLDSMSSDADLRVPAQKQLATMHKDDSSAFFSWLSKLLADTDLNVRVRHAASVAMKQAMAATKPAPPPSKRPRHSKKQRSARKATKRQAAPAPGAPGQGAAAAAAADAAAAVAATAPPGSDNLEELFAILEGRWGGSEEEMLDMLQNAVAQRNAAAEASAEQSQLALPALAGAPLLPVQQLQMELLQTLAAEERQANYLRGVGKQVQQEQLLQKLSDQQLLEKLSPTKPSGFDTVGTVASVRTPRGAARPRVRKPATKPLTADEAFARALAERKQQRPTATSTTWSARDTRDPRVREWLVNKQMESTSQETLDLVNWILILTRQGKMTEDRLQTEMANFGPIPTVWLRQIRVAMKNAAYSQRLQNKRMNRQPSPPRERSGLMAISITAHNGERHVEHEGPIGLLPEMGHEENDEEGAREDSQAKKNIGDALLQAVKDMELDRIINVDGNSTSPRNTREGSSSSSSSSSSRGKAGGGDSRGKAKGQLNSSGGISLDDGVSSPSFSSVSRRRLKNGAPEVAVASMSAR